MIENLKKLLDDHQIYHSDFQMDHFITVRAGETQYGQYKQALRELFKRYRGLKELYVAKELLQIDIDELAVKKTFRLAVERIVGFMVEKIFRLTAKKTFKFVAKKNKINRAKNCMAMEDLEKNIKHTEREFKRFYAQADSLKMAIGKLTPEKQNKLDKEMWLHKLKSMVAIDYITKGRIGENALTFIQATPCCEVRKRILFEIKDHDKLITWFENYDQPLPPFQVEEKLNMQLFLG